MNFIKPIGFLLFVTFTSFSPLLKAQKVYETNFKSEADRLVFVTDFKSEADYLIYETEFKSEAKKSSGLWFWTDFKSEADYLIYFTKFKLFYYLI